MLKKMLRNIAAVLFTGVAASSFAANVLILATSEPTHPDFVSAINNLQTEFQNAGATVAVNTTELSNGVAMNPSIFISGGGAPYDVVAIAAAYNPIDTVDWPVIQAAIQTREANAFLFFVDSCCQPLTNGVQVQNLLSSASGWTVGQGVNINNAPSLPLNSYPGSPYSASFLSAGLNSIVGGWFYYITGIPANNALFLTAGASPVSGATTVSAYGAILPVTQSFGGSGACIFATIDVTEFSSPPGTYLSNAGKIGPAFLNAVTAQGGACALSSSISKAFSPASVSPGGSSTLTITINNLTNPAAAVSGLDVTDNLPSPLQISAAPTTSCGGSTPTGAVGGNTVQLIGATLPIGGCTITVPVSWPDTPAGVTACGTGITVTNTITPGTDFTTANGQVNTPATAPLTCNAAGPIAVTKTTSATTVVPGDPINYIVTVSNTGTVAASNVVITDTPPAADITSVTWGCTASGGATCPTLSGSAGLNEMVLSLPGGGVLEYIMTGTVSLAPAASFTNTVSVNPGNALCASGNPAPCTASATVPPVGMVGITKTNQGAASVAPNGTVTYEVVVTNTGSVAATNVVVSDPTPTGVTAGTWTCTGTCGVAGGNLPLADTILSLAAGGSTTYQITGTVPGSGLPASIINTASATFVGDGVCTDGIAPPCNSNPVAIPVVMASSPGTPVPVLTLWTMAALVLLLGGIVATAFGRRTVAK